MEHTFPGGSDTHMNVPRTPYTSISSISLPDLLLVYGVFGSTVSVPHPLLVYIVLGSATVVASSIIDDAGRAARDRVYSCVHCCTARFLEGILVPVLP